MNDDSTVHESANDANPFREKGGQQSQPCSESNLYEFRVKGHLDRRWSEWFDGLAIVHLEGGETLLSGPVADQAALHGLLIKVRDLGLVLISVNRAEPGPE